MLINRNVRRQAGKRGKTSMRLEPLFWTLLDEICERERLQLRELIALWDRSRTGGPIAVSRTEAARVFILGYYRDAATEEGHFRASHGSLRTAEPEVSEPLAPDGPDNGGGADPAVLQAV